MTIRSAPYYWVECDCCEERVDYGDSGYAAWQERKQATGNMDDGKLAVLGYWVNK